MDYKDLELKLSIPKTGFKWGDKTINVYDYLPIESKYDIVMITLQKSFEDGIYNPIKLDMFYHLNLVYMLTDLDFSAEDRADESKLYDEMKSTGFLDEFLKHIDPVLYGEMLEDIEDIAEKHMTYKSSMASVLGSFIDELPEKAAAAAEIVNNFDPEKYSAVVDFATAANGGRPIQ